jgi:D-glucosaminate-6-phosphate ammonia-lyase
MARALRKRLTPQEAKLWLRLTVLQPQRFHFRRQVPIGPFTAARAYQLEGRITERTTAVLYVVSHHAVQVGQIPLGEFCRIRNARGVPVIVDAASEYDLTGFLAAGAALAI